MMSLKLKKQELEFWKRIKNDICIDLDARLANRNKYLKSIALSKTKKRDKQLELLNEDVDFYIRMRDNAQKVIDAKTKEINDEEWKTKS